MAGAVHAYIGGPLARSSGRSGFWWPSWRRVLITTCGLSGTRPLRRLPLPKLHPRGVNRDQPAPPLLGCR